MALQGTNPTQDIPDDQIQGQIERYLDQSEPELAPESRTQEDQSTPVSTEPSEERIAEELEASSSEEAEPEEGDQSPEGEPEGELVEMVSDLAKAWDMDEKAVLDQLKIPGNGDETISFSQLVDHYQSGHQPEQVEARVRELDAERATEQSTAQEKIQALADATDKILTQIEARPKMSPEDWKSLEEEDPLQYVRLRQREMDERDAIQNSLGMLQSEEAKRSEEQQKLHNQFRAEEVVRLQSTSSKNGLPNWRDQGEAQAALELVQKQLLNEKIGFTEDDLNGLEDHRYVMVAYYAAKYLELAENAKGRVKSVGKRTPKFVPTGSRREPSRDAGGKKRAQLSRKLQETGDERDAARLIEELL